MYHGEGNCEWGSLIIATNSMIETVGTDGQRLQIDSVIQFFDIQATCAVNGNILLNAIISTTGEVVNDY